MWAEDMTIDFEGATSTYSDWTFNNITSAQTTITAHGGSKHGQIAAASGYIVTKNAIANPSSITFYVSKSTTNTTSSNWKVQVSSNNSSWTDVKTQSATSMSKGTWVEVTQSLTAYNNVYVRIYYTGSNAVRCIDDVTLTTSASAVPAVSLADVSLDFGNVVQNEEIAAKTIAASLSNTSSATVSLSGSGASAFSIDKTTLTESGNITITPNTSVVGTFEATLTLSADGATPDSKTISMTVEAPFTGTITTMSGEESADIKFITGTNSEESAIWVSSTPLTANDIALSGSVTSGTNYSYYDGSVVRFYANNSIVITPSNGATITKVEIVRQSTTSSNTGTINCSGLTASNGNTTTNTNAYTGSATSAVTFTNTAQARFTKILVYTTGGKTLQTVTVSGTPTKTTYTAGENFEPAGLTVTGHYDDDSDETITEGITWSTPAALTVGQTSVSITATVNGVTSAAYNVTGLTVNAPVTLSSIAATGTPAEFWKGDAFNHNGITVTATWSDATQTDVTSECSFTGYEMSTPGQQTVTVSYQGETDTYDIEVKTIANTQAEAYTVAEAKALIDAGKDLATQVYVKGTVSQIVTAWSVQYNNITYAISDDGQTSGTQFQLFRCATNGAEVGDDVVAQGTLTKHNDTYEFAAGNTIVDIQKPAAKTITALEVSGTPTKTTYNVGDAFETAGLTVTATYSDETQEVISSGFDWEIDYGKTGEVNNTALVAGATSVDVMVYTEDQEVMSEVYTVNGLTVTKAPFETVTYNFSSFTSGQSVELTDLDGFTITLKGNGGTNPAWSSNQARVYAKGSLTVSANNATIKSIEYSYVVNANRNDVVPTIDGVAGTTNAGTWDEENKTWTGADEEVTFSTSGTAGNIGFTKLIIKYVESNKITPTLSFSSPTAEVTIGADDNVFPTLTTTPADLEGVTYESSNTDVAMIDENTGAITLVAAGETTITASYAGNEDYKAATPASYTLTVVKAPFVPTPAPEGYEVVDFATLYSSVTTNATVTDYEGTSLAMAFAKPQSSTTPTKYYDNGKAVRAYVGNTITITAAENIKYVDIAWVSGNIDNGVAITGLGTTTAVVTFSNTCRFTKITVSYTGSNSTLVATDGENYYATFSSEKNVVFANATAYTVAVADDKLALTEVARNKVPAGNAVLIKSATANVNYYFVGGDKDFEDNMLKACPNTGIFKEEADGNYYYKLAYGDNTNKKKLGFWWGAEDGSGNFKVKAGGAVLVVPQSQAGSNLRGFSFDYEDTLTGLDALEIANDSVIYNIQGQRITRVQQGVNIVNGKKVIR